MEYKQLILVRHDLQLPKGKLGAQCAHAAVEAAWRAAKEDVKRWREEGMAKIVLKVADEKELLKQVQRAKDAGFTTAMITDAGYALLAGSASSWLRTRMRATRTVSGVVYIGLGLAAALTGRRK